MSTRHEVGTAALVTAARAGDTQAQDALVGIHLPLVYNVVGRALNGSVDVDDVVQDTMLRALGSLHDLRDPASFRSWLVAITMNQVRLYWRDRQSAPGPVEQAFDVADPGADFVDLTMVQLQLSGQRQETARATRWLEPDDRGLLSLWWLECAGELSRAEVAAALGLSPQHTAVRVQRMKAQLEAARVVVRAVDAQPPCEELRGVLADWDGVPSSLWRKRTARHARGCVRCSGLWSGLMPVEGLLAGLALVAVSPALLARFGSGSGSGSVALAATGSASRLGDDGSGADDEAGADGADDADEAVRLGGHRAPGRQGPSRGAARRRRRTRRRVIGAAVVAVCVAGGGLYHVVTRPESGSGGTTAAQVTDDSRVTGGPAPDAALESSPSASPSASSSPSPTSSPSASASRSASASPSPRPSTRTTAAKEAATTQAPASSAPEAETAASGTAAQVIALVNKERADAGCDPVSENSKLRAAAQGHSDDMAARDFFDHTNPDGDGPGERITAAGYRWSTYGENIAMGQQTAEAVMTSWMNSEGHRANILNCAFEEIGVGIHEDGGGPWWTQAFGTRL
ncbi:sigma-70 family RNA polymerase sigma factor [Streptomyces sp. NPDC003247]|uniref:sigma-70 family RNA polymerase sigma factor n=1 Tax=Streptomyces sp. NPDC003247 TaxID=3364677 RepID=UPI0036B34648